MHSCTELVCVCVCVHAYHIRHLPHPTQTHHGHNEAGKDGDGCHAVCVPAVFNQGEGALCFRGLRRGSLPCGAARQSTPGSAHLWPPLLPATSTQVIKEGGVPLARRSLAGLRVLVGGEQAAVAPLARGGAGGDVPHDLEVVGDDAAGGGGGGGAGSWVWAGMARPPRGRLDAETAPH